MFMSSLAFGVTSCSFFSFLLKLIPCNNNDTDTNNCNSNNNNNDNYNDI